MWQTIVTVFVLIAAAVYVVRHFLRIYRTGKDCTCSGCPSSKSCEDKRKPHSKT
ncbi:MAG: FeoB-associated Cys-rich membrane protein [Syntrophobacteraceae bacterium]